MVRQSLQEVLKTVLCDVKHVVFVSDNVTRWGGKQLEGILDQTADHIHDTLTEMSHNDPYYSITEQAYMAIPDSVGATQLELLKVIGGPGCGKSTVIKRLCELVEGCTVVVPFKRLQADYYTTRCYTQHNCVIKKMSTQILLVDEFTGCDVGLVCAAALNHGCTRIILWGDVLQTWLQDSEGQSFKDHKISTFAKLCANYRNPAPDVSLLNSIFEDDMVSSRNEKELGIVVKELFGDPVMEDAANLTFTRESVDELGSTYFISAITVRSSQGATYENVNLFVFQRDLNMFTNLPFFRVACSRHRQRLTIYTCHTPSVSNILLTGKISNDHLVGLDAHELKSSRGFIARLLSLLSP